MRFKRSIPDFLTCMNLVCGCLGIAFALRDADQLVYSSLCIALGAIFDFLDGFAARLLKAHSATGKELDSLADMVTFGVLPGFIMFQLINTDFEKLHVYSHHLAYLSLLIPVFSAVRLAKFNTDERQTSSFIGLPTPANSLLIASFPFSINNADFLQPFLGNPWVLVCLGLVLSGLLVAEIHLFALKFKTYTWEANKIKYVFLGISLMLLAAFRFSAMPFIILLYILLSVVESSG